MLQRGRILKALCKGEGATYTRSHITRFHFYHPEEVNAQRQKGDWRLPGAGEDGIGTDC